MQNFIIKNPLIFYFFFFTFSIVIYSLQEHEAINSQMNFMNQVDVPKPILQMKESEASYLGGIIDRARSKLQEVSSSEF